MEITFKEGAPSQLDCKVYPLTKAETKVLHQNIKEDLEKGYIHHGTSSFVSPIFFIPKKDGKELRMVIDYRRLNDITKKDFYPLPNLHSELEKLSKHGLFSKFDVCAGYNNICIKEEDQYKAAFKTPIGTFIPTVMTFGFCNAPSIFQRAMNRDLAPLKQKYPNNFSNYMDDVAIGTDNTVEGRKLHREIVREFLGLLADHSYSLKASKCKFEKAQIEFLGFSVQNGTVQIDPSKIGGISNWPRTLHSQKQVRQILGVLRYQRAFIKNYAHLVCPLHNLPKKGEKFEWTDRCRKSLDTLIGQIATDPVLTAPDESNPFKLETDASSYAVEAALFQKDARGKQKTIGYASKTLNSAERNYDIWDREFLGLIFGLTYWRHLLCGTRLPVQVFVDHANLLHYCHPQKVNRQVAHYILTRPTTTSRSIITQDPLTERMHYLGGQTTIKERRTTAKLPLYPHLCLLNCSKLLHWMPKLRLTIRRIERNTPSYKESTTGKKKQDSESKKDKSLYYQMCLERNSFGNIMIILWQDIQEQLPLTSPSKEGTDGQDSKTISKNTSKDALLARKISQIPKKRSHPCFPSNQNREPTPLRQLRWTGSLNSPLFWNLIPSSPSQIMNVLKRSYSFHIRKRWEQKILPKSITQRCSPTLGSHLRLSLIGTPGSLRNWPRISAPS